MKHLTKEKKKELEELEAVLKELKNNNKLFIRRRAVTITSEEDADILFNQINHMTKVLLMVWFYTGQYKNNDFLYNLIDNQEDLFFNKKDWRYFTLEEMSYIKIDDA